NYYNKNSLSFSINLNKRDFIKLKRSDIFNQSDVILISDYFDDEGSFDKLNIFLEMFKSKKKIVLTSNSNLYLSPKKLSS